MKTRNIFLSLSLLGFLSGAQLLHAGSHTWSGAVNNSWSNDGNWSSGGAPQFGEPNITLIFPAAATRYAATNGVGNYAIDEIVIAGDNYTLGGYGITLTGVSYYNLDCSGTNNVIALPMTLNSAYEYFTVATYDSLTLSGALSGPGGFKKFGRGTLTLGGPAANTYVSPTTVIGGTLSLAKAYFTTAVPTNLIIGDTQSNPYFVEVRLENDHQIDDGADVTVNPNCTFYLQGHMEVINSLHLAQGLVVTKSSPAQLGQLTIFGGVTVTNSHPLPSSIDGQFSLAGAIRTIDVSDQSTLQISALVVDGGQKAGLSKTGPGTLILSGANSFTGDTTINAGVVQVTHSLGLGSGNNNTYVQSGASLLLGAINVLGKHLYLNGQGLPAPLTLDPSGAVSLAGNAAWTGPVTLQSDSLIKAATNLTFTVNGPIDGAGALITRDWGTVKLAGTSANTYSGGTYAQGGELLLSKSSYLDAVPGFMVIGVTNPVAFTNYVTQSNVVRLASSYQNPDDVPVYMNATALFDLNGYNDAVGELTMIGGTIGGSGSLLTLHGNVTGSEPWGNTPTINANVSLGGVTRTFTMLTPGAIVLTGVVSDGGNSAGINKMGPYGLRLDGTNNTYSGITAINEGWLSAEQPASLGSPAAGTIVGSGAELTIGLNFHGPVETLTLNSNSRIYSVGYNSWDGNIILNGDAQIIVDTFANNETLDLNGVISGPGGLTFALGGTLRLGGSAPNTYTGATTVLGDTNWNTVSTLELRKTNALAIPGRLVIGSSTNPAAHEIVRLFSPEQIANLAPVTVNPSGLFDLNNQTETIGSIEGIGQVAFGNGTLRSGGNNADTTFGGTFAGFLPSSFIKQGSGTLAIVGTISQFQGTTAINGGALDVRNWILLSPMTVNAGAKITGNGLVANLNALGGTVVPGCCPAMMQLNSANFSLNSSSILQVHLDSTNSGSSSEQVVKGTVSLGDATLNAQLGFNSAVSNKFMIIDNDGNDPVSGTFKNLPEGATFLIGGAQFQITYHGGDGNDVVLTQISAVTPPHIDGVQKLPNGSIQIGATGLPNASYNVEATDNLSPPAQWTLIGNGNADAQGKFQFVDVDAPNHVMRFYRLSLP